MREPVRRLRWRLRTCFGRLAVVAVVRAVGDRGRRHVRTEDGLVGQAPWPAADPLVGFRAGPGDPAQAWESAPQKTDSQQRPRAASRWSNRELRRYRRPSPALA